MKGKATELEERLIDYAVRVIHVAEAMPETKAAKHIAGQLLRSGTSAAPHYGEAQSGESRRDFIHKMKIALKELRETHVWLQIIKRKPFLLPDQLTPIIDEANQLISIFVASIKTAQSKPQ